MCLWYKLGLSFSLPVQHYKGMCSYCMCNVFSPVKLNCSGWKSVIYHYMKKVSRPKLLLQLHFYVCLFDLLVLSNFLFLILYLENRIYKRQQFWSKAVELTLVCNCAEASKLWKAIRFQTPIFLISCSAL